MILSYPQLLNGKLGKISITFAFSLLLAVFRPGNGLERLDYGGRGGEGEEGLQLTIAQENVLHTHRVRHRYAQHFYSLHFHVGRLSLQSCYTTHHNTRDFYY
jgi:hypothetical protein